jgi:Flp pilus assembly protein TadG
MIAYLKALWRDQRGNSYVEMAFITPILTTALLGGIEVSNAYSARLKLEQAAQRTIEEVQQNSAVAATTYSTIASEASTASGVSTSNITVTNSLQCSNDGATWTTESSSTTGWDTDSCSSYGTFTYYSHYLSVQIKGSYSPIFSAVLPGADSKGNYTIYGTAGLRFQ